MELALIVACTKDRLIGTGYHMPWHLPADLQYFKQLTLHKVVVMGRKTWQGLPLKPLPQRKNLVFSRQTGFVARGAMVVNTLQTFEQEVGDQECFVIGGGQIYELFLPLVKTIYLTEVHATVAGDVYFPRLEPSQWRESSRLHIPHDDNNAFDMERVVLQRIELP